MKRPKKEKMGNWGKRQYKGEKYGLQVKKRRRNRMKRKILKVVNGNTRRK